MRGRFADSVKYLEKATTLGPASTAALSQLALTYLAMKKTGPATAAFSNLLKISNEGDHDEIRSVIQSFVRAGLLGPAVTGFFHIIKNGGAAQVSNYVGLAEIYMREQKYEQAFEVYETGLKIEPASLPCSYNAGHALFKLGNRVKATEYYRRAIDLFEVMDKSTHTKVWLANAHAAMAFAYVGTGQPEKAMQLLANALSIATDLERVQIFSPITYTWISRAEFFSVVKQMATDIAAGIGRDISLSAHNSGQS
jgi:tetratricopeptide (TPR) repeat protein